MNQEPQEQPDRAPARDPRTQAPAAQERIRHQARWVEMQIQQAVARGAFADLPGFGKPIPDLGTQHDPDWWVRKLIEREHITGVLPPALQLRKDDAELDGVLDALSAEDEVRRTVEDFNERVRAAFYQPLGGPPLITRQRHVGETVAAWRARRAARAVAAAERVRAAEETRAAEAAARPGRAVRVRRLLRWRGTRSMPGDTRRC